MPFQPNFAAYEITSDIGIGYAKVRYMIGGTYTNAALGITHYYDSWPAKEMIVPITTKESTTFKEAREIARQQVPVVLKDMYGFSFVEGFPI